MFVRQIYFHLEFVGAPFRFVPASRTNDRGVEVLRAGHKAGSQREPLHFRLSIAATRPIPARTTSWATNVVLIYSHGPAGHAAQTVTMNLPHAHIFRRIGLAGRTARQQERGTKNNQAAGRVTARSVPK